jgi:signal transduction histidine kinase
MSKATVLAPWRESLIFAGMLIGGCGVALFLVTLLALRRAMRERTAIVRLDEEMAQRELAEKALRQVQKIEALGQLTSGVAHDFNNLLTVIAGNLHILRGQPAPVRAGRCIADALSAAERSRNLVESLLAFARQQPLDAKIFDLNQQLVELKPLLLHALPSTVELVLETAAEPVLVDTDVNQTEMTVLNLVVNGRDAMPRGGRIRVAVSRVDLCGEPDGLTGAFAALSVADTGEGMPPEVLEKAFEPFFTTKIAGKGTGLGLSMVHKFALQSSGGTVIRSRVGEGTEVVVYLPLAER